MKSLPSIFYSIPKTASATMEGKDLRELLLETNGSVIAGGYLYDIKSKNLGAGVYKVRLERRYQ